MASGHQCVSTFSRALRQVVERLAADLKPPINRVKTRLSLLVKNYEKRKEELLETQ